MGASELKGPGSSETELPILFASCAYNKTDMLTQQGRQQGCGKNQAMHKSIGFQILLIPVQTPVLHPASWVLEALQVSAPYR